MENIVFTTKNGYEVTLRPHLTGRMYRYIKGAFLDDMIFDDKGKADMKVRGGKINVSTDRTIESLVVHVVGNGVDSDNVETTILDTVLDLPLEDYEEVVKRINEVSADEEKKTNTETN